MNPQELRQLQAERAELERLLQQLPESSVIERKGLEARRREVESVLDSNPSPSREPVRARLTFRGKPIVGSHGMFAEFGAAVVNAFADAVATIGASQGVQLGARGVIPNREDYRLLITGTASGSFGFELEEAPKDGLLFPELSPIESAIDQTKAIMRASIGSDDELTEAVADADPRALETLRTFLKILADQEAVCSIEFKDDAFRFSDVGQIRRSENRLRQDNIHEEYQELTGTFRGVLPKRRTFEFQVAVTEEVISGKVGSEIEDADDINKHLYRPLRIQVHSKRIGTGRSRYTLIAYQDAGL